MTKSRIAGHGSKWYSKWYVYLYQRWFAVSAFRPSQDVQPLSAFRANAAGFLEQIRATKRPLVLTQHGKSAAVILDVDEYEALVDELDVIRDIRQAKAESARGEGVPHEEVVAELRARLSGTSPQSGRSSTRRIE